MIVARLITNARLEIVMRMRIASLETVDCVGIVRGKDLTGRTVVADNINRQHGIFLSEALCSQV